MRNVKIILRGSSDYYKKVTVDGNELNLKKNQFDAYDAIYSTEKDSVEVTITKYFELSHKLWWLMSILYFIISIFGLFDIKYDKYCYSIDCTFRIKLGEKDAIEFLCYEKPREGKLIVVRYEGEVEEVNNTVTIDEKVKKRYKILKAIKIVTWILLVIGAVFLVVKSI